MSTSAAARPLIPTRAPGGGLWRLCAPAAAAALLAACASGPGGGPSRDGPEANPPAGLERLPDAEPRVELLRSGGPNKPYEVLGQSYTPVTTDRALRETGLASWYGRKFHGRPTATGEPYDMYAMTAAHKTMPLPSYARVRNPANGREIIVRVNDRGPFHPGRVIDLSYSAALKLGVLGGVAPVEVERLTNDDIRAGLWRRDRLLAEPAVATVDLPAAAEPRVPPRRAETDPLMALLAGSPAPLAAGVPTATAAVSASAPTPAPTPTPAPALKPAPTEPAAAPAAEPAAGYWLQLGAFRQREGAALLQQRVQRDAGWLAPWVAVFDERSTYRVQAGPYASRAEAQGIAERLRGSLQLTPLVMERR